jgi:lipopolysaccharide biosynthesis protein
MTQVTSIAFYLPQYHPTRVNDVNWGEGFSDWLNVAQAVPQFEGHFQPRLPGLLGFYDLRAHEVMIEQAQLARSYGIGAFCFYYYRFGNLRVLDRPVENYLANRQPDMPFLYCWANEDWTKAWDGKSDHVLMPQDYSDEAINGLTDDLIRAIVDPRYFRMDEKPVFMIYQAELLPEGPTVIAKIKEAILRALGEELIVGAVYSPNFKQPMLDWLDFVVQFPPHRLPRQNPRQIMNPDDVQPFAPERKDNFERYESVVQAALEGADIFTPTFMGVTPDWDNSARRPNSAHILVGSTPDLFRKWVAEAARRTRTRFAEGTIPAPFLFVNAWNEWAEGAMLEPSLRLGTAYLEALSVGLQDTDPQDTDDAPDEGSTDGQLHLPG